MSRLVVFGCSNSYGVGLEDPLNQNYGYHLGKLTKKECINKAIGGSSNTRIAYEVLNFDFQPGDIAILGWTYVCREMLAKESGVINFGAWINIKEEPSRAWLEYFSDEHDLAIKSFMHMHHVNIYLNQKNIKILQFWFEEIENRPEAFALKKEFAWADSIKMNFELLEEVQHIDKTDCNHPGPKTHKMFAEYLYKNFKDMLELNLK